MTLSDQLFQKKEKIKSKRKTIRCWKYSFQLNHHLREFTDSKMGHCLIMCSAEHMQQVARHHLSPWRTYTASCLLFFFSQRKKKKWHFKSMRKPNWETSFLCSATFLSHLMPMSKFQPAFKPVKNKIPNRIRPQESLHDTFS